MGKLKLDRLEDELVQSIVKFETAEATFAVNKEKMVKWHMETGSSRSNAEVQAMGYKIVKDASSDCKYFRDRANMYANTIQAVIALQKEKGL